MCGRYTNTAGPEELNDRFRVPIPGPEGTGRYNIAPTQPVAAVRVVGGQTKELVLLRWGLIPSWADDPKIGNRLINARAETAAEKPSFRSAFRHRS